jgi:hypothetical protein
MERLESIRGLDTPAVLVVVYGNRAYEKALMELDAFAIPHGLKVIAGATFIGEHSYSTDKCPIADGRPNESDLDYAEDFGKKIMEKFRQLTDPILFTRWMCVPLNAPVSRFSPYSAF